MECLKPHTVYNISALLQLSPSEANGATGRVCSLKPQTSISIEVMKLTTLAQNNLFEKKKKEKNTNMQ